MQINLSDREVATIIAALRLWNDRDEIYTGGRAEALLLVATNDDEFQELTGGGVDRLIGKLQDPSVDPTARSKGENVSFHMENMIRTRAKRCGIEDADEFASEYFGANVRVGTLGKKAAEELFHVLREKKEVTNEC